MHNGHDNPWHDTCHDFTGHGIGSAWDSPMHMHIVGHPDPYHHGKDATATIVVDKSKRLCPPRGWKMNQKTMLLVGGVLVAVLLLR